MSFCKTLTYPRKGDKTFSRLLKYWKFSKVSMLLLPIVLVPKVSFAEEGAIDLLNRMNQALHQLNYKGTLAYLRGDSLSTLQIEHNVVNGKEIERVVRLNESGGELSRELQGFSLSAIPRIRPEMEKVYSFDVGRQNRVANIPCTIITARPKDRERYLQKYCIDKQTGMLLDYRLVGKSHKPVEQFMFTTIEIRIPEAMSVSSECSTSQLNCSTITPSNQNASAIFNQALTPVAEMRNTSNVSVVSKSMLRQVSDQTIEGGWIINVPIGYEVRQAPHMKHESDDGAETHHYVVSDGLSTFSVFVTGKMDSVSTEAIKVNSGALNVVSQEKEGHVITVVGAAPETTLKNFVKNLKKSEQ